MNEQCWPLANKRSSSFIPLKYKTVYYNHQIIPHSQHVPTIIWHHSQLMQQTAWLNKQSRQNHKRQSKTFPEVTQTHFCIQETP